MGVKQDSTQVLDGISNWAQFAATRTVEHVALKNDVVTSGNLHRSGSNYKPVTNLVLSKPSRNTAIKAATKTKNQKIPEIKPASNSTYTAKAHDFPANKQKLLPEKDSAFKGVNSSSKSVAKTPAFTSESEQQQNQIYVKKYDFSNNDRPDSQYNPFPSYPVPKNSISNHADNDNSFQPRPNSPATLPFTLNQSQSSGPSPNQYNGGYNTPLKENDSSSTFLNHNSHPTAGSLPTRALPLTNKPNYIDNNHDSLQNYYQNNSSQVKLVSSSSYSSECSINNNAITLPKNHTYPNVSPSTVSFSYKINVDTPPSLDVRTAYLLIQYVDISGIVCKTEFSLFSGNLENSIVNLCKSLNIESLIPRIRCAVYFAIKSFYCDF